MLYENNSPMYVLGFKIEKLEIYIKLFISKISNGAGVILINILSDQKACSHVYKNL